MKKIFLIMLCPIHIRSVEGLPLKRRLIWTCPMHPANKNGQARQMSYMWNDAGKKTVKVSHQKQVQKSRR